MSKLLGKLLGSAAPRRMILAALWTTLLAGCATHVTTAYADTTRYTWTGGDVLLLPQVNLACAEDMEKSYIPRFGGGSVLRTLYKDCVRNSGYVQARESEKGPEVAYTYEVVDGVGYHRYRLESCGPPDQTCLWIAPPRFMGMGGGWGIVPLPSASGETPPATAR